MLKEFIMLMKKEVNVLYFILKVADPLGLAVTRDNNLKWTLNLYLIKLLPQINTKN